MSRKANLPFGTFFGTPRRIPRQIINMDNAHNLKNNQDYDRLLQLFLLLNRKSPLKTEYALLLYTALIRPSLLYVCVLWCN